jgi:hypothetical protein
MPQYRLLSSPVHNSGAGHPRRRRWKFERMISWISQYHHLMVRNQHDSFVYESFLHLDCIMIYHDLPQEVLKLLPLKPKRSYMPRSFPQHDF